MSLFRLVDEDGSVIVQYQSHPDTENVYEVLVSLCEEVWRELEDFRGGDPFDRLCFEHEGRRIRPTERLNELATDGHDVNITVLRRRVVVGVHETHLSTDPNVNHFRFFEFSSCGTQLQTVEAAGDHRVLGHSVLTHEENDEYSVQWFNTRPRTQFVGTVVNQSTLEVRLHSGDELVLVGYESFPGYEIFAHAFDDEGEFGAVLARDLNAERNVVIVFPEHRPDVDAPLNLTAPLDMAAPLNVTPPQEESNECT